MLKSIQKSQDVKKSINSWDVAEIVKYGIWLYQFLIIAYLFTLKEPEHKKTPTKSPFCPAQTQIMKKCP